MKKMRKDALEFVKSGTVMGVGSRVLGRVGGTAATNAQTGISNMSFMMPVMGTIKGAEYTTEQLKKMSRKKW